MNIKKLVSLLALAGLTAGVAGPAQASYCEKKVNTTCSNFHTPVNCTGGTAVGVHSCFRRSNNIDYEVRAKSTGTATYAATVLIDKEGAQTGNCVTHVEGKNQFSGIQCRARYTNAVTKMWVFAY
jgi:hypothetical protein